jgi:hypothetical protein
VLPRADAFAGEAGKRQGSVGWSQVTNNLLKCCHFFSFPGSLF